MRFAFATVLVLVAADAYAQEPTPEPAPAPDPVPPPPTAPAAATPVVGARADLAVVAPVPEPDRITPRFAPWQTTRLMFELELYSQARMVSREGEDLSELRLDRGELGGRVQLGKQAAAELRIEAIRSAVEGGSLGIDGDSTVFRLKTAQLMGTYGFVREQGAEPFVRLDGALGFVPDPWIRTLEDDYTVKPLSRTGSERLLGWPTNDLSGLARGIVGPVRATIAVGNGEGQRFPERNTGKTTTAVLEVVPVNTRVLRLTAAAVARDGSIGVASIRDRRFGGGLVAVTPWVRVGAEVISAQGIGDRGEAEGLLLAGWADARVIPRLFVSARGASLKLADDGGRQSTFGGAVAFEPWRETTTRDGDRARGRFRVWLAVDRVTSSGAAMPLPGADAGDATVVMLIASAIAPFALD